jgi:Homeobox KN domain
MNSYCAPVLPPWDDLLLAFAYESTTTKTHTRNHNKFPPDVVALLTNWMKVHAKHPYTTLEQKQMLALETNLTAKQVEQFLSNYRRRHKNDLFVQYKRKEIPVRKRKRANK